MTPSGTNPRAFSAVPQPTASPRNQLRHRAVGWGLNSISPLWEHKILKYVTYL